MEREPLLQLGFYNNIHPYIHSWNKDFLSTSNGPDAVIGFEEAVVDKTFYLLFKGLDRSFFEGRGSNLTAGMQGFSSGNLFPEILPPILKIITHSASRNL